MRSVPPDRRGCPAAERSRDQTPGVVGRVRVGSYAMALSRSGPPPPLENPAVHAEPDAASSRLRADIRFEIDREVVTVSRAIRARL